MDEQKPQMPHESPDSEIPPHLYVSPPPNPFDPRRLVLRWLISTLAIFAAVWVVPGITFAGPGWQLGIVALLFGLLNALLRPIMILLTLFTLGLFGLIINALLLLMTSALADRVGIVFHVDDFFSAFLGGMIVSLVGLILSYMAGEHRVMVKMGQPQNHNRGDSE
jgi:putative membrane protein